MRESIQKRDRMTGAIRWYCRLGLHRPEVDTVTAVKRIAGCSTSPERVRELLAVRDMLLILRISGAEETLDALRQIYFREEKRLHRKNEVSMRVLRYATDHHWDERTVYRRLRSAKRLYLQCLEAEGEEKAGETFLEKSFPRTPFKRLSNKG